MSVHRFARLSGLGTAVVAVALLLAACSSADTAHADRQAGIIALATSMPRQTDANGLARAMLSDWRGEPNQLSVLGATDLHPTTSTEPAARLLIRITVAAHPSTGVFDDGHPAYDLCYRLDYVMPSSSLVGDPMRTDCPAGAVAITPPPAPPVAHLPADTEARLTRILNTLPAHPGTAMVSSALRAAFGSEVAVDSEIVAGRVAVAAGIAHPNGAECVILMRIGHRIESIHPSPVVLMPGESGCVADLAIHPIVTH